MPRSALTGTRIRERRTVLKVKQADLARMVEISPSYLNLIEHNRRRIGGKLLVRIAKALSTDVAALAQGAEASVLDQLSEAAASAPETAAETERIDELVGRFPGWAGLIAAQQRQIAALRRQVAALADRLSHDPQLAAALHDLLSTVAAIRSTVGILTETEDLDDVWRGRFERNLAVDSLKLSEGAAGLVSYLEADGAADPAGATPQEELEAFLDTTDHHIAALERALPTSPAALLDAAALRSPSARALALDHMQQYRRDAERMPLAQFVETARAEGYDPARLSLRFGIDLPGIFRRLAGLPPVEGVGRIGLVTCDAAGALTLRKSTDGFPLPRFAPGCALWPLFQALTRPMAPVRAALVHAASPTQTFVAYAVSQPSHPAGFDGPQVHRAMMLVVPPGLADPGPGPVEVVGSTCRVCPRVDCPARREPSLMADGFDSGRGTGLPSAS